MSKEIITDFTEGSILKKLIRFSFPFMLAYLLQTLYALIDMIIVGQFVGSAGVSAISGSSLVTMLTLTMCTGFSTAAQILISQQIGAKRIGDVSKTIGTLFTTVAGIAVIVTVAGLLLCNPIVLLLNIPAEAKSDAVIFLSIMFAGTIFTYGYTSVATILRGMGNSRQPLIFVLIAVVTNIALDILLICFCHMGVAGAAVGTISGQAVSFFVSVFYLYHNKESFCFDFKLRSFKIDIKIFKIMFKLGLPLALQNSAINFSMLFVNTLVNGYGLAASATFGVGTRVEQIPYIIFIGVEMACSSMIAQNMGARKPERIRRIMFISMAMCAVTAVLFMMAYKLFPTQIYSMFTSDRTVLRMSPMYMIVIVIALPAYGLMCPFNAFIVGIGNVKLTLLIAILDGFVTRICLSMLLSKVLGMGLQGLFLGYGLAAYVTFILGAVYYFSGIWKKRAALV